MYAYQIEKANLFTDEGQRLFLAIRDQVNLMLDKSGAFTMENAITLPKGIGCADSFGMMACVDRMVELGEIREIKHTNPIGQNRLFVRFK